MTGVLVAAGRRVMSIDDVKRMVTEPDDAPFHLPNVHIVPPQGLYLASVEYDDKGLLRGVLRVVLASMILFTF